MGKSRRRAAARKLVQDPWPGVSLLFANLESAASSPVGPRARIALELRFGRNAGATPPPGSEVANVLADRLTRAGQQAVRRSRSHRPSRRQVQPSDLFPVGRPQERAGERGRPPCRDWRCGSGGQPARCDPRGLRRSRLPLRHCVDGCQLPGLRCYRRSSAAEADGYDGSSSDRALRLCASHKCAPSGAGVPAPDGFRVGGAGASWLPLWLREASFVVAMPARRPVSAQRRGKD